MKSKNELRLQQDKSRLSRQIGIVPNEEPTLITDRKQMRSLVYGRIQNSKRVAGYGECFYPIRAIFVDTSYRLEYMKDRKGQYKCKLSHFDSKAGVFRSSYAGHTETYYTH